MTATATDPMPITAEALAWQLRQQKKAAREDRLARISAEAREVRFGHTLLLLVTGLIVGLAWLAAKGFRVWLVAAAHVVAAVKEGWNDGMGRGPSKAQVIEENRNLRLALERMGGDVPAMAYAARGVPRR